MAKNKAFLGLGSNLGNREYNLLTAIRLLSDHSEVIVKKISSLYETQPVGFTDQPDFLNAVIEVDTTLLPEKLLAFCLSVECSMDRKREVHWGPRCIDIDVLAYNQLVLRTKDLTLPHPYLHQRKFVLIPLHEIAPGVPVYQGLTAGQILAVLHDENNRVQLAKTMEDWVEVDA